MKRVILITGVITFFCLHTHLKSQSFQLPGEDNADLTKELFCFCKPGVPNKSRSKGLEIVYGYNTSYNWLPTNTEIDDDEEADISRVLNFKAKIKIPLVNKPDLKVLLGYEYANESFHFNRRGIRYQDVFNAIDGKNLKTNKYTFYVSKPFNEKYYALMRVRASFNGDYNGLGSLDSRYAIYSGILALGIKPNANVEWGVGLSYSNSFVRTRLLPFMVYNRTFNEHWGIESLLPIEIKGRYNFNQNSIFLFGFEFSSKSYSIDVADENAMLESEFHLRHLEVDALISWERKIVSWLWLNVKAGYQMGFNSELIDVATGQDTFDANPGNNLLLRVGIFLSPPDKFIK